MIPRDAPGVQTIGASNAGAAQSVQLAPRSAAPNPFSPAATLSQFATEPKGSADVDRRLEKILDALGEDGKADAGMGYQSRAMELAETLARDAQR